MPIIKHDYCISFDEDYCIWRYIDLNKFKSLLETRSLFFCRADRFSDPFEGSIPKKEVEFRIKMMRRAADFYGAPFNQEKSERQILGISSMHQNFKRGTIINCWHINDNESDAMWKLYLKSNEGIAIQTTIKRLLFAFKDTLEEIVPSKVRYIDYENEIWYDPLEYPFKSYNLLKPFFHKKKEFMHEYEFRLFHNIDNAIKYKNYWIDKNIEKGKLISVNLNDLIGRIILPPTADNIIESKVNKLIDDYGLNIKISKSSLLNEPYY